MTNNHSDKPHIKAKDFHRGYAPTLLRSDVKTELKEFRVAHGFGHESHIERCLVTAGIELLIGDETLHERWIAKLAEAASQDVMVVSRSGRNY